MSNSEQEKNVSEEMRAVGRHLSCLGLVAATSGNLSSRISGSTILITATGAALGDLSDEDIVRVDLNDAAGVTPRVTSEYPLHRAIYQSFSNQVVIHCHPPLANAYFAVYSDLKVLTFESKLYLGTIPVIPQETPAVTALAPVIEAFKTNNLVVLKNHGVVAMAPHFQAALNLIQTLEEAVKVAAVARLFKKEALDELDRELGRQLQKEKSAYPMFSPAHIQAIVDLVNQDAFIAQKGKELELTVRLAITMDGSAYAYTFNFEQGKITRLDSGAQAPFVISAPPAVWQQVFLGKLDSFVAVTQGKMKLAGPLGQLSKWYVPFTRLFSLFTQVPFK